MPLSTTAVGSSTDELEQLVDARWIMSYAAGLGVEHPAHLDPFRPGGLVAHPMLSAAVEWPVVLQSNRAHIDGGVPSSELGRGVHATHDVTLHRPIVENDRLRTRATIESLESRRPGGYQVVRLDTVDATDAPVFTTRMGSLFLGVDIEGESVPAVADDDLVDVDDVTTVPVEIGALAAHVYTEGARIWNPIHTDPRVAAAAGLPAIILHGTATLAHAVSSVIDRLEIEPGAVGRIRGRFGAMVLMPSSIAVEIGARRGPRVGFRVRTAEGDLAISHGEITIREDL